MCRLQNQDPPSTACGMQLELMICADFVKGLHADFLLYYFTDLVNVRILSFKNCFRSANCDKWINNGQRSVFGIEAFCNSSCLFIFENNAAL